MQQNRQIAKEILESTSFGRVSRVQQVVLELLLEKKGTFVRPKDIADYLVKRGDLSEKSARSDVSRALAGLQKKMESISTYRLERMPKKGVRVVNQNSEASPLAHPSKAKPNDEMLMREILARFTRLEQDMAKQFALITQSIGDLKVLIEKKQNG